MGYSRASLLLQVIGVVGLLTGWLTVPIQAQSLRTIPGMTPPEQTLAEGIVTLCPPLANQRAQQGAGAFTPSQNDLIDRCSEMVRNGARQANIAETRDALLNTAPEEVAAQGTNALETASVQLTNLGTRLAALRGGATGISLQGLAFNINGQLLPGHMLASLVPGGERWDAGRTEGSDIVRPWGSSTPRPPFAGTLLSGLSSMNDNRITAAPSGSNPIDRLGLFVNGTIGLGDKDTTSREAGFDFTTLGVTAGVDYRLTDRFVLGLAFGFASTDADVSRSGGGGDLDTKDYSFSLYSTYYLENFYIDGIVSGGWNSYDTSRRIDYILPTFTGAGTPITTAVNQVADGDTDGSHYSLGFGAGYDFRHAAWTFGPYTRLSYLKTDIDAFQEDIDSMAAGSGLALAYEEQDIESLQTALGVQVSYAISTSFAVLVPQLLFEWVHEFLDDDRTLTARFVDDPAGTAIPLSTDDPDRNFFNLGLALSSVFREGRSAFIYYQNTLGLRDVTKHDIVLGVRLAF